MVYKIQQSAAKKPENQFEFQMPDSDKVYSVPLLQFISPKLILSLGDVSDPSSQMTFTQKLLEYYSTDGMPLLDLFDDGQQMMDWFEAWQEASTISLGESKASETSSKSTEAQ
ncbi:hypothetical protein OZX67_03805 [Bifidobacterium sp. ESL0728]|uniref:hypothetical protein n=1 Tax=Bifidobacterium sp. ESL0728 TaxID=2983220 RepID=UPI0023F8698D|nr:hypothetical protein [Bifidobacterium sp. ESL0728]WEV59672.1 hypothetical protein OZX67_03805 [Bifidobacterium sp. ESL0728]